MKRLVIAVLVLLVTACGGPIVDAHRVVLEMECGAATGTTEIAFPDHHHVREGSDCGMGKIFGNCHSVPTTGTVVDGDLNVVSASLEAYNTAPDKGHYSFDVRVPKAQLVRATNVFCRFYRPVRHGAWQDCHHSKVACRARLGSTSR